MAIEPKIGRAARSRKEAKERRVKILSAQKALDTEPRNCTLQGLISQEARCGRMFGLPFIPSSSVPETKEETMTPTKLKDSKESLTGAKPDITHVRLDSMVYESRAKEYGSFKYERANYLRDSESVKESVERLRTYVRGSMSHWMKMMKSLEDHQANDPDFDDLEGLLIACYAEDDEVGNDGTPASLLPHACGALASGAMAVTIAVKLGLLPEDPGQPWVQVK